MLNLPLLVHSRPDLFPDFVTYLNCCHLTNREWNCVLALIFIGSFASRNYLIALFLWCYDRQRTECWEYNFWVYCCQGKTVEYFKLFECYTIEVTAFQISVSEWRSVSTHISSGLSKMTHISHLMTPLTRMKIILCLPFCWIQVLLQTCCVYELNVKCG